MTLANASWLSRAKASQPYVEERCAFVALMRQPVTCKPSQCALLEQVVRCRSLTIV